MQELWDALARGDANEVAGLLADTSWYVGEQGEVFDSEWIVNNEMNDEGKPALHVAAEMGRVDLVDILLEHGANVDASDEVDWNTPLMDAVHPQGIEVVVRLLEADAAVNVTNIYGQTALDLAVEAQHLCSTHELWWRVDLYENIVQLLVERGGRRGEVFHDEEEPEGIAFEVHNAFKKINLRAYKDLLRTILGDAYIENLTGYPPDVEEHIREIFNGIIGDNEGLRTRADQVLDKLFFAQISDEYNLLILNTLHFMQSQNEEFQLNYVTKFVNDNCEAYTGSGDNMSCLKGIIERFVFSLEFAFAAAGGEFSDDERTLLRILRPLVLNDLAQEYDRRGFLQSGEAGDNPAERRAHFIEFVRREHSEIEQLTRDKEREIERYANDNSYAFEGPEPSFGGRKKKRKTCKYKKRRVNKKTRTNKRKKRQTKSKNKRKRRKTKRRAR